MAKFKLELQLKKDSWMLLTDFDSSKPSKTITFNEQLQEGENDSYSLSFDMPEFIEDGQIRTGSLIAVGRVLRLTYSKPERKVWFVIKNFSIGEGRDNFIYSIEAQDYAGYVFARNNVGLTLDTINDEDFWEWLEEVPSLNKGITTITNVGNYILERGWLRKHTKTGSIYNFEGWEVEVTDKTYGDNNFFQYNISVSESNTYNALIELANTSDTFLRINYETKVISFIHRDNTDENLDKNYTLREDFNILESSVSFSGEEMYSIFYVDGGTDENDEFVTLSEQTDYKDNFLYDFRYYKEKGLITEQDEKDIKDLILGKEGGLPHGFTRSLKEINDDLQKVIKRKYFIENQINKITNQIRIDGEALLPSGTVTEDFPDRYEKLLRNFQAVSESEQIEEKEQELQVGLSYKEIQNRLDTDIEWELAFPFSLVTPNGEKIEVKNNYAVISFQVPGTYLYYGFRLGFERFEVDPNPQPGSINKEEVFWDIKGKKIYMGWVEEQSYVNNDYPGTDWQYDQPSRGLGFFTVLVSSSKVFDLLKYYYPYYEKMIIYDGMRKINIERQKIKDQIDFVKDDWIEAEKGLEELIDLDLSPEEKEARKEGYFKRIEDNRLLIGDYLYNGEELVKGEEDQKGYLTLWEELFEEHFTNFLFMFNADGETIENKFGKPVMESYRELMKEKQDFWFEIKKQYGNNIFSEGYYENQIETSSLNLKDQADLIYKQHKQPNEDFTISYIDVSDVIGIELNEILVGDYIKLNKRNLKLQEIENSVIQVSQISRELRKDSDISLSISRYNIINKLLEKIVAKGG